MAYPSGNKTCQHVRMNKYAICIPYKSRGMDSHIESRLKEQVEILNWQCMRTKYPHNLCSMDSMILYYFMINFVVSFSTSTSTLLTKYRKTKYTFPLTLSHYNQTLKNLFPRISFSHYTSISPTSHFLFSSHFDESKHAHCWTYKWWIQKSNLEFWSSRKHFHAF